MRRAGLFSFFFTMCVTSGLGQTLTGTFLGTITDQSGAVLPNVEVTATHTGTNQSRSVLTNGSGNYSIPNLPVGPYRIQAVLNGFQTALISENTLQIDQSARHDFVLVVGDVTLTIEVTAETPLLQTDESSIGSVIDEQKILELPLNGRKFEQLIQLVPGTATPAQGSELGTRGGFNSVGMDENFTSFFLDGFDNVDPVIRNFSFRPSIDAIQEFKVEQNSYAAEFGRNAGAVVNVTTKSGTNDLHGAAWEFLRNDNLDARNVFATEGVVPKPDLIRNEFGVALGGPIARDKTFFFFLYEGLREKRGETRRATVPTELIRDGDFRELVIPGVLMPPDALGRQFPIGTIFDPATTRPANGDFVRDPFPGNAIPSDRWDPSGIGGNVVAAYPLPNVTGAGLTLNRVEIANHVEDANNFSFRIDHQLFANTDVMFRYSFSDAEVFDPFRTETSASNVALKDFGQTNDRIRTNTGIGFTTVLGPNVVHESRFGYNRFKQPQTPVRNLPPEQEPVAGFNKHFLGFNPVGTDSIGSGNEFFRVANVFNYINQLSWFKGNHQLKFGLDVRRYQFNAFSAVANQFIFVGLQTGPWVPGGVGPAPGSGLADMLLGLPFITFSFDGAPQGNTHKTELAAYIQDDWQIAPDLTLNYGLRWEWYGRVLENVDKQSTWDPACNCILIAGDQRSIPGFDPNLFQFAGNRQLIEDDFNNFAPRLGFAYRPFGNDSTVVRGGAGIFYDSEQRHNFPLFANAPFFNVEQFMGLGLTMSDPFPTGTAVPAPLSPNAIEKNYRDTYAEHWSFGIQHEILEDTVLDVAYVGNHLVHGNRSRNVNQAAPGAGRPFAGFAAITLSEQAGSSSYHSLQTRVERRFLNGLTFLSSYAWGHAIDDRPAQGVASNFGFQNDDDPGADRGNADFDVRHRYTLSFVYDIPEISVPGTLGIILNGWGMKGILTLQSGRPFTVYLPDNNGTDTSQSRPDVVAGVDPVPEDQGPDNWIDSAAFSRPAPGSFGNLGRNTLRGPGLGNLDFSVTKDIPVAEGRSIQFRTEFFNLTNHPNFGLPNQNLGLTFGEISTTVTTERQIQFGLRYDF